MVEGLGIGLAAIGAGIAIAGGAFGTAMVQSAIGSAGVGALAEKPQVFGQVLIYLVIPETIVIFSLVVAYLIISSLGGAAAA